MKNLFFLTAIASLVSSFGIAQKSADEIPFSDRQKNAIEVLKQSVANGLPGVAIAYSDARNGEWVFATGYSNVEKKQMLTNSNLHYLQSVSKLYMAVEILKLAEEKRLNIYDPISKYLTKKQLGGLASENISIKMLLGHTSGIRDYASDPQYAAFIMKNLNRHFTSQDCIDHVKNLPLDFAPGSDYAYSNTNYVLLAMIADVITGDHVAYLKKTIFEPLKLKETHCLTKKNYREVPNIADSYWDVLNNGKPVNITDIQKINVSSMRGDDGIVCSTRDAVAFMKALVEGRIVKPETLQYMEKWTVKDGQKRYGLGLAYYDLGATYAIGHSGGGLGAGCVLMYLPEQEACVFLATNFNTMIESKIGMKCAAIQYDILKALFL